MNRSPGPQDVERLRAETATQRHVVDDPGQADLVGRVVQEAEDGQDVLDLLAVVEADAADDPVGDVADPKRLLQDAALRRRPVHDRDVVAIQPLAASQAPDLADDELRLVVLVGELADRDRRALFVLGPEPAVGRWVFSRMTRSAVSTMRRVER